MDWQPIDTAPKDGTRILLLIDGMAIEGTLPIGSSKYLDLAITSQHGCGCCATNDDWPTHWMPLPQPPNEGE